MLTAFVHVLHHVLIFGLLRQSRVRLAMVCMFALISWPWSSSLASPRFPQIKHQIETEAVTWGDLQNMIIGGVPVSTLPFVSPYPAVDVASRFSSDKAIFQRVLSMPGQLILSGLKDEWHWIAVLNEDASGSSGYVSAMSSAPTTTNLLPPWMPPGSSVAPSVSNSDGEQAVVQHVHHISGTPDAVRDRLATWLSKQGWKTRSESGDIRGIQQWHRQGEELVVLLHPSRGGTVMFTQQKARGRP